MVLRLPRMLTVCTIRKAKVKKYFVLSKPHKDAEPVIELIRNDEATAKKDVQLFKEICQKFTWIEESK